MLAVTLVAMVEKVLVMDGNKCGCGGGGGAGAAMSLLSGGILVVRGEKRCGVSQIAPPLWNGGMVWCSGGWNDGVCGSGALCRCLVRRCVVVGVAVVVIVAVVDVNLFCTRSEKISSNISIRTFFRESTICGG